MNRQSIDQAIQLLTDLKKEVNDKDIIIKQMSEIITIVEKLITDPELIRSSDLKLKYFNEINTKLEIMGKSASNGKIHINPVYVPEQKKPKIAKDNDDKIVDLTLAPKHRPKVVKTQIVTEMIQGKIEYDIYTHPGSRPKIIKGNGNGNGNGKSDKESMSDDKKKSIPPTNLKINIKKKENSDGTFYGFQYKSQPDQEEKKYYINFQTGQISDEDFYIIGKVRDGIITIKDDKIVLPVMSSVPKNSTEINETYAILD